MAGTSRTVGLAIFSTSLIGSIYFINLIKRLKKIGTFKLLLLTFLYINPNRFLERLPLRIEKARKWSIFSFATLPHV
jgi:hypothetical protein